MKCDEKENDVDSGDDGDAVDHNDEESEDTHTHTHTHLFDGRKDQWKREEPSLLKNVTNCGKDCYQEMIFLFRMKKTKNEDNNRDIVHRIELEMGNI